MDLGRGDMRRCLNILQAASMGLSEAGGEVTPDVL
jgi:DNA polymerase III delta prime subunit